MPTDAELKMQANAKNALRRSSGLPLIDVAEEVAHQRYLIDVKAWNEVAARFEGVRLIYLEEEAEKRFGIGWRSSANSISAVGPSAAAWTRFVVFMEDQGHSRPDPVRQRGVRYGGVAENIGTSAVADE